MEAVLTADDRAFFDRWGYLVVKGVVPKENCDAVVSDIYTFLQMDPNDTTTWYPPERRGSLATMPNGSLARARLSRCSAERSS